MIAFKYTLFAIVSILLNLLFQYLSLWVYDGTGGLVLAMCSGTGAGLVCKYVLDKKFIFHHKPTSKTQDARKFVSYTLTGGFTTFIFWATEIWFDWYFDHEAAKYVGAAIGLSVGYVMKYFLDRKYVFTEQAA